MAITPRILQKSPAALAVVLMTVLGVSVFFLGYGDFDTSEPLCPVYDKSLDAQITQVYCFHELGYLEEAYRSSERLARMYPESLRAANLRGYFMIEAANASLAGASYEAAVSFLTEKMLTLPYRDATLVNNLAWAALYTEQLPMDEVVELAAMAITADPMTCEILHTGLVAEYTYLASGIHGFEMLDSISRFRDYRDRYVAGCLHRFPARDHHGFVEEITAIVAITSVHQQLDIEGYDHLSFLKSFAGRLTADQCEYLMPAAHTVEDCEALLMLQDKPLKKPIKPRRDCPTSL